LNVHAGRASQLSNLHSEIIHPILGYKARPKSRPQPQFLRLGAARRRLAWLPVVLKSDPDLGQQVGPSLASLPGAYHPLLEPSVRLRDAGGGGDIAHNTLP
jgi:hypothetical protein